MPVHKAFQFKTRQIFSAMNMKNAITPKNIPQSVILRMDSPQRAINQRLHRHFFIICRCNERKRTLYGENTMQSELNIKYIRCKTKKYNIYGEFLQTFTL